MHTRKLLGQCSMIICAISTILIVSALFIIIWSIFIRGLPSLTWYFLTTPENATPGLGQGIANAVVGTVLISFLATCVATPLGIGTAVYLQRYAKKSKITETFQFLIEVLSGTPSIILGIFGILTLVYLLKAWTGGFSLISGTIALSILIIPVIVRSVENAIELVPRDLEEGSYALGATKWQTVRSITLPVAFAGIITGVILAFGRAAEESAVVILTAGYSQFIPELAIKSNDKLALGFKIYPLQDLVGTLPYSVYHAYINSNVVPMSAGFAAAFILVVIVLCINLSARAILSLGTPRKKNPSPLVSSLTRTLFKGNRRLPRQRSIPAPADAAAELTEVERESAIRVHASAPQKARLTPSPISTTSEINWKETLSAGLLVNPVQELGSTIRRGDSSVVSEDSPSRIPRYNTISDSIDAGLFEDELVLLSEEPDNDPKSPFSSVYPLLEEDPDPLITEPPADEPWRRMARNRLENTIAGVTADPWEEP